ncbi:helix-turn-helix transcriptional regulator [Frankia sp. AgKG'84/4]|uniref:helix-turn-helix transcriptional regulator n=1 Tax=Frankia sp. AgKG'84/4 TaxID=573490 RepID=UPI0027E40A6E|nr:DNA-binding protein [Frankia sp. AgKG'84/4]
MNVDGLGMTPPFPYDEDMAEDDLWTTADVASRLTISVERARRLCSRDDFPQPVESAPYFDRWRAGDVEAWLLDGRGGH